MAVRRSLAWILAIAVILSMAGVIAGVYRSVAVEKIVAIAHQNHVSLAEGAFGADNSALAGYLGGAAAGSAAPLPAALDEAMRRLSLAPGVKQISIVRTNGIVSASTAPAKVGAKQPDDAEFRDAMAGKALAKSAAGATVVESFMPVRARAGDPVQGVMQIETDVGELLAITDRTALELFAVIAVLLAALALIALRFLRSTRRNLGGARRDWRDRAALVEILSNRRLRREEQDRKRLATDLHEDLAQSLSAIKFAAESAGSGPSQGARGADTMNFVVSELQRVIQRVRTMASDLRPSSLDEFGVLAAIRAMCREFEDLHPQIHVELEATGREDLIPAALGIIVYRNVESALKLIGDLGVAKRIHITLIAERDSLVLAVGDDMSKPLPPAAFVTRDGDTESPLSPIRERTIMSGGELAIARGEGGAVELRARWAHPNRRPTRRRPRA